MKGQHDKPTDSTAEWIVEAQRKKGRCCMCRDVTRAYLQELITAINTTKAFKISVPAIYARMAEVNTNFKDRIGFDSFRLHLANHEPTWHRSKVK